jgi:hypothetical protein
VQAVPYVEIHGVGEKRSGEVQRLIQALSGKKRGGPIQELKPEPVYELSPPAQEHPVKKMLPKPKPQEEFPNLLEAALKEFTR